ncbi:Chorismate pyruvate-lyase [Cupriavidus laharis]|uniref:Probable chorismate pyruvate-lyase n=1 Tax=Cupriavidus laharis TaxID=151654 RepID=A0ABM8X8W1_9BURK|nr:chorismate lyase [Cupriavidus laharis]CAG9176415.1 Chorismate pyruvate-lyase [Cupriavidus laharis]
MSAQYARRCGWTCHLPFDTAIPPNLRHWVTGEGSLTARLVAASERFRVRRLFQASAQPYLDEWQALGQCCREPALTREVLLICDEQPAVYAHTVVRERHARRDWPFLRGLGERPLGGRLFVDPAVRRDPFQFARLLPHHPLRQALQRVLPAMAPVPMLPARRSVFRRGAGVMLVTEVFLPDLLARPSRGLRQSRPSDRGPD